MRRLWFAWLCAFDNHGPSRVKWGFQHNCRFCTHLAWKRGWF